MERFNRESSGTVEYSEESGSMVFEGSRMQYESESSDIDAAATESARDAYLIATHIIDRSNVHLVDDARLVDEGIPVWIIIDFDGTVAGDTQAVAQAYGVSEEAVEAARAFYRRHSSEIDARIAAASSAFA